METFKLLQLRELRLKFVTCRRELGVLHRVAEICIVKHGLFLLSVDLHHFRAKSAIRKLHYDCAAATDKTMGC